MSEIAATHYAWLPADGSAGLTHPGATSFINEFRSEWAVSTLVSYNVPVSPAARQEAQEVLRIVNGTIMLPNVVDSEADPPFSLESAMTEVIAGDGRNRRGRVSVRELYGTTCDMAGLAVEVVLRGVRTIEGQINDIGSFVEVALPNTANQTETREVVELFGAAGIFLGGRRKENSALRKRISLEHDEIFEHSIEATASLKDRLISTRLLNQVN